jgi:hypothetical protein
MSLLRLAIVVAAGCGSSAAQAPDAIAIDAFPTAPHTAYPQVPNLGGPVLAHPQLITVTFANDTRAPMLEAFAQWIVGSSWLATVGPDYGIGTGAVTGVAHRPETPPDMMASADIEAYLAAGVMDGSIPQPAAPATLADALYIVYYPSTTAITATFVDGIIKHSCSDFGGYHGEVRVNGLSFAYAAIPTCAGVIPGLTDLETTETIVSHEFIEAATDAAPISAPAYQLRPDPTDAWYTAFEFEVEVGDLCEVPSLFVREAGFVAQRIWSNTAVAAGGEPCLPVDPTLPAFGVTATPGDTQHIAPGASLDITLTGWSTGAVADWKLAAQFFSNPGITGKRVGASLGAMTLGNGGMATVHITVPAGAASGNQAGLIIISSHTPDDGTIWPIAIDVQ